MIAASFLWIFLDLFYYLTKYATVRVGGFS
jgi:hypothetical protein